MTAPDTVALRREVLRGGRPVPLPGDDAPAFHVGAFAGDALVGTGNVRRESAPWAPDEPAWRLRGMATDPAYRGKGAGSLVLDALVAHCVAEGGGLLWCHARTPAQRFYERAGLQTRGEPWVDAEIGPHVVMWRRL
ncbi:MAG: GNAT family N-acetyltransferase [Mycobacteriales bacterium]